jgi:hypothetical protein
MATSTDLGARTTRKNRKEVRKVDNAVGVAESHESLRGPGMRRATAAERALADAALPPQFNSQAAPSLTPQLELLEAASHVLAQLPRVRVLQDEAARAIAVNKVGCVL